MAKKKNKDIPKIKPAHASSLSRKDIRTGGDVSAYKKKNPVWQVGRIDTDGDWGWKKIGKDRWENRILPKLKNFESMTWQEIEQQSGGRSKGTNSHPIPVDQLTKEARDRLLELQIDDVDELFSLRLEGKVRVFGVRSGHVMQLLWFDFEHNICESKKKNT